MLGRLVLLLSLAGCAEGLVLGGAATRVALPAASLRARNARMETPPPPPGSGRLGATIDQDGKSNVWAVEPAIKVENEGGFAAFFPVAAVAAAALLCVPLLPLLFGSNPDQA